MCEWVSIANNKFAQRNYSTYGEYLEHQRSKTIGMKEKTPNMDSSLVADMVNRHPFIKKPSSVVCLGARLGGEVQGFIKAGHFAVGIDLYPGPDNPWVLVGDFHKTVFADSSVDIVHTNSLDHINNPDIFLREIYRILKPAGLAMIELIMNADRRGPFESFWWDSTDSVGDLFCNAGFEFFCIGQGTNLIGHMMVFKAIK